jgi:hypothetical protein
VRRLKCSGVHTCTASGSHIHPFFPSGFLFEETSDIFHFDFLFLILISPPLFSRKTAGGIPIRKNMPQPGARKKRVKKSAGENRGLAIDT